ncbi:MAG: hypothetical protein QW334_00475 [Thermofilum sp.]
MSGVREKPVKSIVFPLIIIMLFSIKPQLLKVSAAPVLDIPLYKNPVVDGAVSTGEYPVKQFDSAWGKMYAVHNASSLVLAVVLDNSCRKADFLFNTGIPNSTTLSVSTTRYSVERSGGLKYFYGQGDKWIETTVSNVYLRVLNQTVSWTVEISIPLSKLNIYPNTPGTLGFALIASSTHLNYSWPDNALLKNPSTWGVMSSPDNWATRSDIALDGIYLEKKSLIAGSNLTLTVVVKNAGDAAIPDYKVTIMLDDIVLVNATGSQLGLKTPLEERDRVYYEKLIVNVANGSHVVRVGVKALNVHYDADENNNFCEASLEARYAKIRVLGRTVPGGDPLPGVIVELENESQVIVDEEGVLFQSSVGSKRIRIQEIHSPVEGLRYVFTAWRRDGSVGQAPELAVDVQGDLTLTAEYRREYLVNLSFFDQDNVPLTPSFYVCMLTNNTVYNGTLCSLWMVEGDLKLSMVKYAGLNVLDEIKTHSVHEPMEIRVLCNVVSGSVKIIDPFSMPIGGAELTAVFLNNTRVKYVTGPDGTVNINRVAGGEVTLTVLNLGYSITREISFSPEREVTIRIPVSLNVILIVLGAMLIVVAIIVFKIFWKREKPAPRRGEEYEFEEL